MSPLMAFQAREHAPPRPGMWWSGFDAQVVPGVPCRPLLQSPGHELHCASVAHTCALVARIGEVGLESNVACATTEPAGCGAMRHRRGRSDTLAARPALPRAPVAKGQGRQGGMRRATPACQQGLIVEDLDYDDWDRDPDKHPFLPKAHLVAFLCQHMVWSNLPSV